MQRADNAGPHTVPSSEQKAFTSLSFKGNTLSIMENQQKNPAAATLVYLPGILLVGDLPYFGRFGFRPAPDARLKGPVDQRRVLWRGEGEPAGLVRAA